MPEVLVEVRWPDDTTQLVYSPSLVVTDRLTAGATYDVPTLVDTMRAALGEASDRVEQAYGFPCSRAAASIAAVEARAAGQSGAATVVGFRRD